MLCPDNFPYLPEKWEFIRLLGLAKSLLTHEVAMGIDPVVISRRIKRDENS